VPHGVGARRARAHLATQHDEVDGRFAREPAARPRGRRARARRRSRRRPCGAAPPRGRPATTGSSAFVASVPASAGSATPNTPTWTPPRPAGTERRGREPGRGVRFTAWRAGVRCAAPALRSVSRQPARREAELAELARQEGRPQLVAGPLARATAALRERQPAPVHQQDVCFLAAARTTAA
jgi:hypothetical protein